MKHLPVTTISAVLWVVSTAAGQGLPLAAPQQVGLSAKGLDRIDPAVQKFIDDKQLAGVVTIVARQGKVVQFKAYGMMDLAAKKPMQKDTIFRIYSMTKPIVSVAAMILHEKGKLELDAPVSKYVPGVKGMRVGQEKPKREMTVRDLLRHTSGLPNNVTVDRTFRQAGLPPLSRCSLKQMVEKLDTVPLIYSPGEGWHYSFATEVLARLVEVASGRRVDQFLSEKIFRPLGMKDTGFHVPTEKLDRFSAIYGNGLRVVDAPQPGTTGPFSFKSPPGFLSGGGGLVSTAADYMRFCLMLAQKGAVDGTRLLRAETVEEMTRNQLPKNLLPISRKPTGRGFGLGFAVRVEKIDSEPSSIGEYEWLGGAGTEFWISPRDELVVITLTQQLPMRQLGRALKPIVYGAIVKEPVNPPRGETQCRRYHLLDSRVVASTDNARLTLGTVRKAEQNPLFTEDKPWEARFDNMYPNVIYDEDARLYKCWYTPFLIDQRTTSTPIDERNPTSRNYMKTRPNRRDEGVCYAVSTDGIHWKKPELGLVDFGGSKKNNIVLRGPSGAGVFKDLRDPDPARRYKLFFSGQTNLVQRVAFSPDGLHWSRPIPCPEMAAGGDTHNSAVWSPGLQKYVGIMRLYDGQRIVGRTESPDFVNWTKARVAIKGIPRKQTHGMVVFRSGRVYLGLLGIMDYPGNDKQSVRHHVELAWSADSITWHRVQAGTPLIGHTPAKHRKYGTMPYDWGAVFASTPIFRSGEIRLYYGASDWFFFDWRKGSLALATLRPDGWAGYEQIEPATPATVETTPLQCRRDALRLSADVRRSGSITVTLLDQNNKLLAVSEPIKATVTDAEVKWVTGFSLEKIEDTPVRIKFEIKDARLYSFSFQDLPRSGQTGGDTRTRH